MLFRSDRSREAVTVDSEAVEQAGEVSSGGEPVPTPERILLDRTLDPALQDAVDALPQAFLEAVWLRDVEEFSYGEIAEMLAVHLGTVMSRISRGRRLLYDALTRKDAVHV